MGQGKEHMAVQWHHRSRGSRDHPVDCARVAEAHCDCHRIGQRGQQVWHLFIHPFKIEIIHWPIVFRFQSRQFDHIDRILPDIPMDLPNCNHRFCDRRWTVFGVSGQSRQSNRAYAKRYEMSMLWRGQKLQGWSELWSIDLQCTLPRYITVIVHLLWQCTNGDDLQNCCLRFQRDSKWQDYPLLPGEQFAAIWTLLVVRYSISISAGGQRVWFLLGAFLCHGTRWNGAGGHIRNLVLDFQ